MPQNSIVGNNNLVFNTNNDQMNSSTSQSDSEQQQSDEPDGNSSNQFKLTKALSIETTETQFESEIGLETEIIDPKLSKFIENLEKDYDTQIDELADKATDFISKNSFFNFGLYQFISFVFVSIAWTVGNGWYAYVSVFTGYTPEHECDYRSMGPNFTQNLLDSKCSALHIITNQTIKCTKWTYDTSQMLSTIITEYNFVCDKNYYFELAYSIEQIGYIVGTLIFSFIADIVGRKPVLIAVLISMSVCGLAQYFITNFILFMSLGFIINSLACGLEAVCVTLVLEMFSTSKRTIFGIGIEVVWVIVLASMAPLAYFIKLWREIRLIIFIVLAILGLLSHFFVQESIRWLISVSKIKKVNKIISRISKFNHLNKKTKNFENLKKMFDELEAYNSKSQSNSNNILSISKQNILKSIPTQSTIETEIINKKSNNTVLDIIKNKKFRLYVLIMSLNWFATALVYDGLTYLNNYIGENIFLNWIAMNLIELPAQFVCYFVISRYGRRLTVSITLILAGLTLLATFVEMFEAVDKLSWLKLLLFILAKFIVTQSYSGVILHAPELFPTNLRSFGYGICLFSGKITSVLSPMISIYLSKIKPILPAIIYGALSVLCGVISLYVPETLNRPLPNSIDDVVKWSRDLSPEEWKVVKEMNKIDLKGVCLKKRNKLRKDLNSDSNLTNAEIFIRLEKSTLNKSSETKSELLTKSNTLPSMISNSDKTQLSSSINSSNLNLNIKQSSVQFISSSSTSSSSTCETDNEEDLNLNKNLNENDVIVI